jgi:MFS family permease
MRVRAAWRRGLTVRPGLAWTGRSARPAGVRRGGPRAWAGPARLALGTASALGLGRFAYGLLVPAMRAELGWSLAQAGALTTANGLGYLVGAVVTAPVARRLGVTATFRLGMVLTAVSLAATAATSSYPLLLLTRAAPGRPGRWSSSPAACWPPARRPASGQPCR